MALGSPVIGADLLPDYGGAPPLAPAWSFTGCYVGGNVGGRGLRVRNGSRAPPGGESYGQSLGGHDLDDWIGGVQAGCDYQFAGGIVVGIAGTTRSTDAKGSHASAREFGVFYHSDIELLAWSPAESATPGIACSATSKSVALGRASTIRLRRS